MGQTSISSTLLDLGQLAQIQSRILRVYLKQGAFSVVQLESLKASFTLHIKSRSSYKASLINMYNRTRTCPMYINRLQVQADQRQHQHRPQVQADQRQQQQQHRPANWTSTTSLTQS